MSPPLYAADIPQRSLFEDSDRATPWDLRKLDTILQASIPPSTLNPS
jgi:hypothetical protein